MTEHVPAEKILRVIRAHPRETAAQYADRLGMNRAALASRLSKWHLYGKNGLDREEVPCERIITTKELVWWIEP